MTPLFNFLPVPAKRALIIIVLITFFSLLLFILPYSLVGSNISTLLSATTVLLAILIGFFLAATLRNYTQLQSLISSETSNLINIFFVGKILEPNLEAELQEKIDNYMIAAFDHELSNYIEKTWPQFNQIKKVIEDMPNKLNQIYPVLLNLQNDTIRVRQEITLSARRIIGPINWIIIIILVVVDIMCLYSIRDNTLISNIVTVLLSTTAILILFLLDEIDSNRFAEDKIAFEIYQRVFVGIGKMQYYPEISVKKGRIRLAKGEQYRIGKYKNFPKSFEKSLEIVKK